MGEVSKAEDFVQEPAGQFSLAFAAITGTIVSEKADFSTLGGRSDEVARMEQTGLIFKVMMDEGSAAAEYIEKLRFYAAETPMHHEYMLRILLLWS